MLLARSKTKENLLVVQCFASKSPPLHQSAQIHSRPFGNPFSIPVIDKDFLCLVRDNKSDFKHFESKSEALSARDMLLMYDKIFVGKPAAAADF